MYNMIIVDDDEVICKGLSTCFDWKSINVNICKTALNGNEAYTYIKENDVDIVISDICMPIMDGLELSGVLRQEYPRIKIVLVSAFDEFKYAQQAVRVGVVEYITKPFTKDIVLDTVKKIVLTIDNEQKQLEKTKKNKRIVTEYFLKKLISDSPVNIEELLDEGNPFGSTSETFRTIALRLIPHIVPNPNNKNQQYYEIIKEDNFTALKNALHNHTNVWHCIYNGMFILVFKPNQTNTNTQVEFLVKLCDDVLSQRDECHYTFGIGIEVDSIDYLSISYRSAQKAIALSLANEQQNSSNVNDITEDEGNVILFAYKELISEYILKYRFYELISTVEKVFMTLRSGKYSIYKTQLVAIDILFLLYRSIANELISEDTIKNSEEKVSQILVSNTLGAIENFLIKEINNVFRSIEAKNSAENQTIFNKILDYIGDNYQDPNLTRKSISDHMYISCSYLSHLFKTNIELGFSDYLTKIRMDAAIKLLIATNMKTYEVSDAVGYSSSQYFSVCFKKYTSYSPTDYRLQFKKTL